MLYLIVGWLFAQTAQAKECSTASMTAFSWLLQKHPFSKTVCKNIDRDANAYLNDCTLPASMGSAVTQMTEGLVSNLANVAIPELDYDGANLLGPFLYGQEKVCSALVSYVYEMCIEPKMLEGWSEDGAIGQCKTLTDYWTYYQRSVMVLATVSDMLDDEDGCSMAKDSTIQSCTYFTQCSYVDYPRNPCRESPWKMNPNEAICNGNGNARDKDALKGYGVDQEKCIDDEQMIDEELISKDDTLESHCIWDSQREICYPHGFWAAAPSLSVTLPIVLAVLAATQMM